MSLPYTQPNAPAILFRDPAYLSQVGLSRLTALEYFSLSPFFDRGCTNEVLRMQNLARLGPVAASRRDPKELQGELKRFIGTEFVLVETVGGELSGASVGQAGASSSKLAPTSPSKSAKLKTSDASTTTASAAVPQPSSTSTDLYVIHKRLRQGPQDSQVKLVQVYFILSGDIMRAPDIYRLVGGRLLSAMQSIQSSLRTAYSVVPPFDPTRGVSWRLAPPREEADEESEETEDEEEVGRLGRTKRESGFTGSSSEDSETDESDTSASGEPSGVGEKSIKREEGETELGQANIKVPSADQERPETDARMSPSLRGGPRRSSRSTMGAGQEMDSDAMEAEDESPIVAPSGVAGRRHSTRSAGKRKR